MKIFAALDASDKSTHVCVLDGDGVIARRGVCATDPAVLAATLERHARGLERVVLETGPLSAFLYHGLIERGVPAVCICARHAEGALSVRINKSDAHDAEGLAQLATPKASDVQSCGRHGCRRSRPAPARLSSRNERSSMAVSIMTCNICRGIRRRCIGNTLLARHDIRPGILFIDCRGRRMGRARVARQGRHRRRDHMRRRAGLCAPDGTCTGAARGDHPGRVLHPLRSPRHRGRAQRVGHARIAIGFD